MTGEKKDREQRIAEDETRIAAKADEDIDTDDIPEVLDWSDAVRGRFYQPVTEQDAARDDPGGDA